MGEQLVVARESAKEDQGGSVPKYESPVIVTYTSEQILEQIGPALTCSPTPCGVT